MAQGYIKPWAEVVGDSATAIPAVLLLLESCCLIAGETLIDFPRLPFASFPTALVLTTAVHQPSKHLVMSSSPDTSTCNEHDPSSSTVYNLWSHSFHPHFHWVFASTTKRWTPSKHRNLRLCVGPTPRHVSPGKCAWKQHRWKHG